MIKVNKFESYAIVASQGEPGQFPEEREALAYQDTQPWEDMLYQPSDRGMHAF